MFKAKIEGTVLEVCEECLRYGEKIEEPKRITKIPKKKKLVSLPPVEEETVLVNNYGILIIQARKKRNLTREEFAKKINEKESVIRRVESEEMKPDDALTKKIEKFLEIKLRKPYEKKSIQKKQVKGELTLGDIVEIE